MKWHWPKKLYKREVEKGIKVDVDHRAHHKRQIHPTLLPVVAPEFLCGRALQVKKVSLDFPICKMVILQKVIERTELV